MRAAKANKSVATGPFLDQANQAIHGLRRALVELVTTAGGDPMVPQEVAREFGLDKTLTWKISKIIREDEAAAAIVHVPGRKRMNSLISAMLKRGAPEASARSVWEAYDEFERLVEVQAGDRSTLDVMASTSPGRTTEKRLEQFRKSGFQSAAAVWGVRAQTQFSIHMMAPCELEGVVEELVICGFMGLQRMRPNLPWAISNAITFGTSETDADACTPIHSDGLVNGGPILPQFCSEPLPSIRTVKIEGINRRYELREGPVGQRAAVDVALGWRWPRQASMYGDSPDELGEHGVHLSTPVESSILELWVHRSFEFAMNPKSAIYSELPSGPRYPNEGPEAGRLPLQGEVADLGPGVSGATSTGVPRSGEMVAFGAKCLGGKPEDFHGYRYRIKYPPIPTVAFLRHPLMQRP